MLTERERRMLGKACRQYRKGRFVEEEDIQVVRYLSMACRLRASVKDGRPCATGCWGVRAIPWLMSS